MSTTPRPAPLDPSGPTRPVGDDPSRTGAGGPDPLGDVTRAALLDGVLASANDAVFVCDERQRVVLMNRAAERLFGRTAAEATGQPVEVFVPERFRGAHAGHVHRFGIGEAAERQVGDVALVTGLAADGTEIPLETTISTVEVAGRRFFTVIHRDIRRRLAAERSLRESERFVREVLDSLTAHVAVVDDRGVIVAVNRAWQRFAAWNGLPSSQSGEGCNYLALCESVTGPDAEAAHAFAAGLRRVIEGAATGFELEYPCHGPDVLRWFVARVAPLPGDGARRVVVAHEDVTDRHLAQEDLLLSKSRLEATLSAGAIGTWFWNVAAGTSWGDEGMWALLDRRIPAGGEGVVERLVASAHDDDRLALTDALARVQAGGPRLDVEFRVVSPEGRARWLLMRGVAELDEGGRPRRVSGACVDVTQRKDAEHALHLSLARYAALVEASPDAILVDHDGHVSLANPACLALFGAERPSQLLGKPVFELVHPDDHPMMRERLAALGKSGEPTPPVEARAVRLDGTAVNVEIVAAPFLDGSARAIHVVIRDISERRRVEHVLRHQEAMLREAGDIAHVGGWEFDPQTGQGSWTEETARIHDLEPGMPVTAAQGLGFFEGEPRVRLEAALAEAIAHGTGYDLELELTSAKGVRKWVRIICHPVVEDGRVVRVRGSIQDITQRRRRLEALRASEERLRLFIDHAPAALAMFDRNMRYLSVSRRWLTDYGLGNRDVRGLSHYDVFPEIPASWRAVHVRGLQGEVVQSDEDRFVRANGDVQWLRWEVRPWRDGTGEVAGIVIFSEDISARKRAEETVQRFVSGSPSIIYALAVRPDANRLTWVGGSLKAMTGWDDASVDDAWWFENIHPDDRARVLAANPTPYDIDHQILEFRFRRKDGTYLWVRDEKKLLRDAEGQPSEIVGSWSDVTERVELEEKFRQAQKLEAIGRLAGGIAHDFNNILTIIAGNGELLARSLQRDADRALLGEIREAGERAATLTRQLLAFSRSQVLSPQVIDLNLAVSRIDTMLRRLIGEDVLLSLSLSAAAGHVRVDPGQLEQVLLNLAVNARDAMPRGGRLAISTASVMLDEAYCRLHRDLAPGRYAELAIADTGIGMTAETRSRIFEPFFTTKGPGKGTGLGLATVFGIVKQSGGHIDVTSTVGAGTRFAIFLPNIEPPDHAAPRPAAADAVSPGRGTILLVEDEASVRRIAQKALERLGYDVVSAANGHAALEAAERCGGKIDLLMTDLVMPAMSGRELAASLSARWPHVRVLYVSGHADEALARLGFGAVAEGVFLYKPFNLTSLSEKVRAALAPRRGDASGLA